MTSRWLRLLAVATFARDGRSRQSYTGEIMVTEARLEANRHNAALSTGPRSGEGKLVASKNAIRHGLLSDDLLMTGESKGELEDLRRAVLEDLKPEGAVEAILVEHIVANEWRLRRLYRMEVELLGVHRFDHKNEDAGLGKALLRDAHHGDVFPKLARYDGMLRRGQTRALHELERLQARRRGEHVPLPAIVDINVSTDGDTEPRVVDDRTKR